MAAVEFFCQDISFKLPQPRKTTRWIRAVIDREGWELNHLNFIFCSDSYLLTINQRFLHHETFTDIITFDNGEGTKALEGDIFISIERVTENAGKLQTGFDEELHRVMVHGVLHLVGYSDKTLEQKTEMRKKEDAYLSLRKKAEY